jgi:hypothetical protein
MARRTESSAAWGRAPLTPAARLLSGHGRAGTRLAAPAWAVAVTTRRSALGVLLLSLLPLAGCSVTDASPDSSPSTTSSSRTPSSAAVTSSAPTPEEEAAETATTVVNEMLRVTDAAKQNPGARDWEPEIRRFAGDPAALLAVTAVRDYATIGLRQEGDTAVALEVTDVDLAAADGPTVRITGCYDSQSTRVVRVETGEVIPPGTPARYVWDITVTRYEAEPGSPWLVNQLDPLTDRPC